MNILKRTLVLLIAGLAISFCSAQGYNPDEKLPLNPNVKHGVLDNGITYYVLHNSEPKERASFYLVQNVGAILENDNQNGLAHFLEHMAFNGTQNFPKKGILEYLESYGVAFGRNINAYTSVDETVYNLSNVPTKNRNVIDSALLVLHDWCDYLLLTDEEIDSERGVIHEEWRTRRSGRMRVYYESRKLIFQGSKYAERDVIGSLDVIDNHKYETLRNFYKDWYRTDLQAVIVVGDIDADAIELKIKELFGEIKPIEDPKKREYIDIPANEEPIVGVITDPEESNIRFSMYIKHKATPFENKNLDYYRKSVLASLYSEMFGVRFNEILQKGTPPFIYAYATTYNMARLLDVYAVGAGLKEDNMIGGIEVALTENERVLRHGFLETELERAKISLLSQYEKAYKERNKTQSDRLVREYQQHYLSNEPAPGIEYEYEIIQKLLPTINIEEINTLAKEWNIPNNQVLMITGIEKEGLNYPTNDEILAVAKKVKSSNIEPYEDMSLDEPLISEMPKPAEVAEIKELGDFEATEWTLKNGAKVIIKTTDFKENEIIMNAFSKGGSSLVGVHDLPSAEMLGGFVQSFGVGNFDNVNLQKLLTGKILDYSIDLNSLYEGFSGSSSIKDFETLLQIIYLQFEKPRFDEEAFNALKARYVAYVANMGADINKSFRDTISLVTTDYNPRTVIFNSKSIDELDFETMKKLYIDRFVDASDFTFVFVGNINADSVKPLIETYIGGIKSINREENWIDNKVIFPENNVEKHFEKPMQTPKTSIYIVLHGNDIEYNMTNRVLMSYVSKLLSKKYLDIIREEEGGSYGVRVRGSVAHYPFPEYGLVIKFDTDPDKAEKLKGIVYREIQNLITNEIDQEDFIESRENFIKQREENLRKNSFWLNAILHYYKHNEVIVNAENYDNIVTSVTKEQIQEFAKKYLFEPANVEVVMNPAE